MSPENCLPDFASIHLYALLAAAFALLAVCINKDLYSSRQSWFMKLFPLYPLVLVAAHVTIMMLPSGNCPDSWNLALDRSDHVYIHGLMIWTLALFGIAVYGEYLGEKRRQSKLGFPRPASSA